MALAFERRELPSNSRSSDLHVKQMSLCVEEIHGPEILTSQIRAQLAKYIILNRTTNCV